MKNLTPLLILLILLSGCSTESYDGFEELNSYDANGKQIQSVTFNSPDRICAGEEALFSISAEVDSNIQVQQYDEINDEWFQIFQISKSVSNPQEFSFNWDESGDYLLRYKAGSGGFTETTVNVSNCEICEESFAYESLDEETYNFSYTSKETVEDAELVFTFAQSVVITGLEGWTSSGQTKHLNMDLESCKTYVWTVKMEKNCQGSTPNSNVWTDFKVNEVSKKNDDTPNIVKYCR